MGQQNPALREFAKVSVVIPAYNEAESAGPLCDKLLGVLPELGLEWEVIFVDDGSTDGTFAQIEQRVQADGHLRALQLRRNFGKSQALSAGFAEATGDVIVTLDADLQDDPAEIPRLLEKLAEGYDVVTGWKQDRRDPFYKRWPSKVFNRMVSWAAGTRIRDVNSGFKAYRAEAARSLRIYGELYRLIPVLAHWRGFRIAEIPVQHHARRYGRSKYGAWRMVRGFLDLLTVVVLTRFLRRPLHLFGLVGAVFAVVGFALAVYLSYVRVVLNESIGARPLLMLAVLLIITGVQLVTMGLLAELLLNLHPPVDDRPVRRTL